MNQLKSINFTCIDMNKERIRLVGGLQAILTLLKELLSGDPCHADHHEQAIHLVRLLTTCVTDNGKPRCSVYIVLYILNQVKAQSLLHCFLLLHLVEFGSKNIVGFL